MLDKLHNCPNCGGYLNDRGRCEFCGSKVYDFCDIDLALDPTEIPQKTYLRIKTKEGIWTVPVYTGAMHVSYPASCIDSTLGLPSNYISLPSYPEIDIHFYTTEKGTYDKDD